jgi:hypothetical protein
MELNKTTEKSGGLLQYIPILNQAIKMMKNWPRHGTQHTWLCTYTWSSMTLNTSCSIGENNTAYGHGDKILSSLAQHAEHGL